MIATCATCPTPATSQCASCKARLCDEHTIVGQQLITARQLVTTTASTAVRAPALLGEILFKELAQVGYCPQCREHVANQRQAEQLKFLGGLFLGILLLVGLILLLSLLG